VVELRRRTYPRDIKNLWWLTCHGGLFASNGLRLAWPTNKHEDFLTPLELQNVSL
jgi:hypothetical protein